MFLIRKYRKFRASYHNFRVTIRGSRFDDLRNYIDHRLADLKRRDDSHATAHSVARLEGASRHPDGAVAVISCMPPAETGIATCTLLTFRTAAYPVDIFAAYGSIADYLLGVSDPRLCDGPLRLFELGSLPVAHARVGYRAEVLVIGNSDHNVPLMMQLRQARRFPTAMPLIVHIHDACLLNLCKRVMEAEGRDFRRALCTHYGLDPVRSFDFDRLLADGIHGLRPLFADLGVDAIVVNSQAAAEMVASELPDVPLHVLFHPFLPVSRRAPNVPAAGSLRIGSFGVAGGAKRTDLVVDAFRILRRDEPDARLVLAGFDMAAYAAARGLRPEDGFEVHDSPTDAAFDALLQSVDVAVQLRLRSLGESSGPISRLLQIGKPVILSNIGSFADYRDVARAVDEPLEPADLARIILEERTMSRDRQVRLDAFRKAHAPDLFCRRLGEVIDGVTRSRDQDVGSVADLTGRKASR